MADVIYSSTGQALYRLCGPGADGHHHHVVCRMCGRAAAVESSLVERWSEEIAKAHGFVDVEHTVEVFGTCPDCAGDDRSA
jgi:Fur family ferric uptake transcriptional regulator